jgi:hypothetical protein
VAHATWHHGALEPRGGARPRCGVGPIEAEPRAKNNDRGGHRLLPPDARPSRSPRGIQSWAQARGGCRPFPGDAPGAWSLPLASCPSRRCAPRHAAVVRLGWLTRNPHASRDASGTGGIAKALHGLLHNLLHARCEGPPIARDSFPVFLEVGRRSRPLPWCTASGPGRALATYARRREGS